MNRSKCLSLFWALALLVSLFTLPSCGGGGSNDSRGEITGVVLDAAVVNLRYSSDTGVEGFTGPNGEFTVPINSNINFFIGDVLLNQNPIPADFIITLLEFVPGAVDETNGTVTNLARLLQTLDIDGIPENGIELPNSVNAAGAGMSIDFTQPAATFETDTTVSTLLANHPTTPTLITAAQAQMHFGTSLAGTCGGLYIGTYEGDELGDVVFVVNRLGDISGYNLDLTDTVSTELFGFVDSSCSATFSFPGATGFSFTGQVDGGALSGVWSNSQNLTSGTFVAFREQSYAPALLSDDVAIFDFRPTNDDYEGGFDVQEPGGPVVNGFVNVFMQPDGSFFAFFDPDGGIGCVEGVISSFFNGFAIIVGVSLDSGFFIEGSISSATLFGSGTITTTLGGTGTFDFNMSEGLVAP